MPHGTIFVLDQVTTDCSPASSGAKNLVMLNLRKPAFLFNLVGVLLFIIGLYMVMRGDYGGETLIYIGLSMAVIYWFWSIIDVVRSEELDPYQKKFWLIIVIAIPAFGGALYHVMHQQKGKIVT